MVPQFSSRGVQEQLRATLPSDSGPRTPDFPKGGTPSLRLAEINQHPDMLMKMEILIGEERVDSTTSPQNQVVEMQSFSGFESSAGARVQKDVKNEGRSGYVYENKGWGKPLVSRSGYVDENTAS